MNRIETLIAIAFTKAAQRPENRNSDGSFNWEFIDGDVFLDRWDEINSYNSEDPMNYVRLFDKLATIAETDGV